MLHNTRRGLPGNMRNRFSDDGKVGVMNMIQIRGTRTLANSPKPVSYCEEVAVVGAVNWTNLHVRINSRDFSEFIHPMYTYIYVFLGAIHTHTHTCAHLSPARAEEMLMYGLVRCEQMCYVTWMGKTTPESAPPRRHVVPSLRPTQSVSHRKRIEGIGLMISIICIWVHEQRFAQVWCGMRCGFIATAGRPSSPIDEAVRLVRPSSNPRHVCANNLSECVRTYIHKHTLSRILVYTSQRTIAVSCLLPACAVRLSVRLLHIRHDY